MRDGSVEGEPPVGMGLGEILDEVPPEAAREHLDGGEEPVAPDLPFAGGDVEPGVRHQAVQVRMPVHPQVLGVQHGGSAGPGAEARGIGADGAQGLGGGPEEDVEDNPAVLQRDPGDRPRQREDDMEVRDRQDAAGLPVHPLARCGALAGRAMAVAAGLPDGMHVAAAGAPVRGTAERRRPAALDAVHDLQRDGVERAGHAHAESRPGAADDVRHAGPVAACRVSH